MAEMRDGTIKEVLEKLRRVSGEIAEINNRLDLDRDRTGANLDALRVRIHSFEDEMTDLRRQSVPQQAGTGTFIPTYSGERSSLSRFLKRFHAWALSHNAEDALSYSRPIIMTSMNSRSELKDQEERYGRQKVEKSLVIWSALTKAVEKDRMIADIVVGAKAPS